MEDEHLLTIGQLAAESGLSIHMLRNYDKVDVLRPAMIDARTRYRWYNRGQISIARLILYLRSVGLSLEDIRQIVQEEANAIGILHDHRQRLAEERRELRARMRRINRLTCHVDSVVSAGVLDLEAIDRLTPQHYLMEDEIWLETSAMTSEQATRSKPRDCSATDTTSAG
jgi:DNA-binding transcriptional MerR regulator